MDVEKIIISILMLLLLSACGGDTKAKGPIYKDVKTSNDKGKIILYIPADAVINNNMYESKVLVNTIETSAINLEGYHEYIVEPGTHIISVINKQAFNENIAINIKPGETIYIKYSFYVYVVDKDKAVSNLKDLKLQYTNSTIIKPFSIPGKAFVAKRRFFMNLKLQDSKTPFSDSFFGPPGSYIVDVGENYFDVEAMLGHGDSESIVIYAKKGCLYIIDYYDKKRTSLTYNVAWSLNSTFVTDVYCN